MNCNIRRIELICLLLIVTITTSLHRISASENNKIYDVNRIRHYNSSVKSFEMAEQKLNIYYQEPTQKTKEPIKELSIATIFVGDSRTVGMKESVDSNNNEYFVCKVGKGLSWLKTDGIYQIDSIIKKQNHDKYNIIFLFGVNDLYNINNYKNYYDYLIKDKYKQCNIYFCSVNPVIDGFSSATNKDIDAFNNTLRNYNNYIDTNSLIKNNFVANDGLHYDKNTYKKIYSIIKENIENI